MRENIPSMEVAPETVDVASEDRAFRWASDNPLVRAVARVPLPIRAKQLFGTIAVAALLALVAVLGLVALGQSNSRGTELRRLQQEGGYEQLLLTDATQLKQLLDFRLSSAGGEATASRSDEPLLPAFDPASYELGFLSAIAQQIGNEFNRLCLDAGVAPAPGPYAPGCPVGSPTPPTPPHLPFTLHAVAPSLLRKLEAVTQNGYGSSITSTQPVDPAACTKTHSLFLCVTASSGTPQGPVHSLVVRADRWAASFAAKLAVLTGQTQARANALVASDRRSYTRSRDLLIGAGAGSLLLALALGLLLSDSVLVPLRKTQTRLAAIAAGDFSGHVQVPNRDEIGALAADVNRMSDELRRLYQELETASRHKSDFLATMSHELRTPLNAIIGFSEVLREQMFGELNKRQTSYVDDVLEAARHLLLLINDVLDLAKIEAGRIELDLGPVSIPDVLRGGLTMFAERARRSGIALALALEQEEITVEADERRVRQVVYNLLSNAVKFTPAQGRIDVAAAASNGAVEVSVADTGPGISAEDRERIFQEFEQARDVSEREGTGLGLALSRKFIELHGGRLWVDTSVGEGSTFRFTLPVRSVNA